MCKYYYERPDQADGTENIEVWGKFTPRGGLAIDPYANYGKPGTEWEAAAKKRLMMHDMYPENVSYR